jgi:hypothetical protein
MAILTQSQGLTAINSANGDSEFLAELSRWIATAQSLIEQLLGGRLEQGSVILEFAGFGNRRKYLPYQVVSAITKVEYRDDAFANYEEIATADYRLVQNDGAYYCETRDLFRKWSWYRITMTAGWATIPAPVVQVATEMLSVMYEESRYGKNTLGMTSVAETVGGIAVTKGYRDMLPRWREMLSPFRVPSV